MPRRFIGIFLFVFSLAAFAQAPASPSPASPPKVSCSIDTSAPNEGDNALARKDYRAAETFFRKELEKSPNSPKAGLGLTRALIGLDDITGAFAQANKMLEQKPVPTYAELAVAEASYRAARFDDAFRHLQAAERIDVCDGQVKASVAQIAHINALHAREALLLDAAHRLRPNDEIIRRDWIDTLPPKRRLEELTGYLSSEHALSGKDTIELETEQQHLKARRPNECHVSSKTEKTIVPFKPVFGDNSGGGSPMAFGLDILINGKRRRVQIDSGASGILLTKSAARGLNLTPEFNIKTGGIGDKGDVDSYLTHVGSIRIGDVEVSDCMVEVLATSKLDVDGLIGTDVFSNWLVTLEYQSERLTLAPLPARPGSQASASGMDSSGEDEDGVGKDRYIAPEMKDWTRIVRIGHNLMLPAQIGKGPQHYLIADTGASTSLLALTAAKEAGKVQRESDVRLTGISGEVKDVYRIENQSLIFDHFRIPPDNYLVSDFTYLSHNVGAEVSGLLGLPTLSRLTIAIDYRDNLLKISYDPNRDRQRF